MTLSERVKLIETLVAMAEIYGRNLSEAGAKILANDLDKVPFDACMTALEKCRKELRTFPTVADIFARTQASDGRPGPEEAWAMLPKNESDTAVWTEEMRAAFGVCCALIGEDDVAARMSFREVYEQRVREARDAGRPVKWSVTLGHSKTHRQTMLEEAVRLGRIESAEAQKLLPDGQFVDPEMKKIAGGIFKTLPYTGEPK